MRDELNKTKVLGTQLSFNFLPKSMEKLGLKNFVTKTTVNNEHTCNFLFMQFLPGPKRSEEYREVRGFLLGMRQPGQGLPVERRKAMTSLHLK